MFRKSECLLLFSKLFIPYYFQLHLFIIERFITSGVSTSYPILKTNFSLTFTKIGLIGSFYFATCSGIVAFFFPNLKKKNIKIKFFLNYCFKRDYLFSRIVST